MMCIDDVSLYWVDVTFHMSISMFLLHDAHEEERKQQDLLLLWLLLGEFLVHLTWRRWRMAAKGLTLVVTISRIWFGSKHHIVRWGFSFVERVTLFYVSHVLIIEPLVKLRRGVNQFNTFMDF